MGVTKSFKELIVWQKSHEFVLSIYAHTKRFPREELFGLTSQFRRAAVSIAANIAEGYAKKSKLDKLRFFNISQGSLEECKYYIILSKDLLYLTVSEYSEINEKIELVSKLLINYIAKIKESLKD